MRLMQAIQVFFRILLDAAYASRVARLDASQDGGTGVEVARSSEPPAHAQPPSAAPASTAAPLAPVPAPAAGPAQAPAGTTPPAAARTPALATAPAASQEPAPAATPTPAPASGTAPATAVTPAPGPAPLQLLAMMQQEGRLVDFLQEEIQELDDAQIGAAVREIHTKCRRVIAEKLSLEPVLGEAEGATVVVPVGFDPSAIRLMGNVKGNPPFKGVLRHHGWRAAALKINALPRGVDPSVVAPAEVEVP